MGWGKTTYNLPFNYILLAKELYYYGSKSNKEVIMRQRQEQENKGHRKALFLLFFFLLSAGAIVLSVLCLNGIKNVFIQRNILFFSIVIGIVICLLYILSVFLIFWERRVAVKGLLSVYLIVLLALVIWFILQETGFFRLVDTPEKLQQYLQKAGVWMPVLYILLQFLQVVILPIPSIVSTVAGVALFGAFWSMIYSLVGILLGSLTAFLIGRKLGNKAVSWMIGAETLNKWQKRFKGKDNLILTFMFLLPLFPDDILCFIAGLSTMTTRYFLIAILLSRSIGIFATCYSIDLIPFNTWWGLMLWGLLAVFIVVAFVLIYKYTDKIQEFIKKIQDKHKKKK